MTWGSDPPAPERVYLCQVGEGDEAAEYVTVLSPEVVSSPFSPNRFVPNDAFSQVLQHVVAEHAPDVAEFQAEAGRVREGSVYIIDRRTPTPQGPVSPEDIIGGFKIAGGRVVPSSYFANPGHRLLTTNGFFRLDPWLHDRLVAELVARSVPAATTPRSLARSALPAAEPAARLNPRGGPAGSGAGR